MPNLDPDMRMHVVRGLQSEMLQRAERDRITRSRRVHRRPDRAATGRVISQAIRRLRPAVHQEVQ